MAKKQTAIRLLYFRIEEVQFRAPMFEDRIIPGEHDIEMKYEISFPEGEEDLYSVNFYLEIDGEPEFSLDVNAIALFESENPLTEEEKSSHFINLNSPAIAFPYLRSFVSTLTTNAGMDAIILPAFNFSE